VKGVVFDVCVNRRYALAAFASQTDVLLCTDVLPATADDETLMALARTDRRILVTEDVGSGALVFRDRLPPPPGLILLAVWSLPHAERAPRIASALPEAMARADGAFVTLGPRRVRARTYPH
jgi:predicted nuclease of predicted toxin-antitoxin system